MIRGKYPRFSFTGRTIHYNAEEVAIYDPDTFFACFPVEGVVYEHAFRVNGIDSIENKIKKTDLQTLNPEQTKVLLDRRSSALIFTKALFEKYQCSVQTFASDKYGRILCQVTLHTDRGDLDLANELIRKQLVFPYQGDTKLSLVEQAEFCIKKPIQE